MLWLTTSRGTIKEKILPSLDKEYYRSDSNEEENNTNINNNIIIQWTLDFGASYNMTHNLDCLSDIQKHKERVYFADGSFVESKYIGTFIGYINENKIKFKDVLYIPEFKRSLLFIGSLCNSNYYNKINNYNYFIILIFSIIFQ